MTEIQTREETSRMFFDTEMTMDSQDNLDWEVDNELNNLDRAFSLSGGGGTQAQAQLLLLEEENTRNAERRETEVRHIVKSIVDLNDIFKDLSHMVIDQVSFLWLILSYLQLSLSFMSKNLLSLNFGFILISTGLAHKKISLFLILQMFNLFLYQPFDNFTTTIGSKNFLIVSAWYPYNDLQIDPKPKKEGEVRSRTIFC